MRFDHPVFRGPRQVDRATTAKVDPYTKKKIQAWRVQEDMKRPGLVASRRRFVDSPDSEILAGGINMKGDRGTPLVREGNIFLWGFSAPPSKMTAAGKATLVNAIAYMKPFADKVPTRRVGVRKRDTWEGILRSQYIKGAKLREYFSPRLVATYGADKAKYREHLATRIPYLYVARGTQTLAVDRDAEALGHPTNSLALIRAALQTKDPRAQRVLDRYWPRDELAPPRPKTTAELDKLASKIWFSEPHGYRWLAQPPVAGPQPWEIEDALDALDWPKPSEDAPVTVGVQLVGSYTKKTAYDKQFGLVTLAVRAEIKDGWHVTVAAGDSGATPFGIELELPKGMQWQSKEFALKGKTELTDGVVHGHGTLTWTRDVWLKCAPGTYQLKGKIRFQACDIEKCLPDVELPFTQRLIVR